jgi:hypothetical protein
LARRLRQENIGFDKQENCFVEVQDLPRAQALLAAQLRTNWNKLLDGLLTEVHPAKATLFGDQVMNYYWSAEETEWATDILFRSPALLAQKYPRWLLHALTTFGSDDVLRFLGRRPQAWRFHGSDIVTTLKTRPEGTRIKHQLNRNALKMYDKQGSVLRVETIINDPRDFRVYRSKGSKQRDRRGNKNKGWHPLRKGVADLHRRAQVGQKSNERYLEALAAVDHPQTLKEITRPMCQRTTWHRRSVRGLQPFRHDDAALLQAIARGEFAINGFRNRHLRALLFGSTAVPKDEARRQSSKITRLLRMLRAHGIIRKIPKTHRYQLTDRGRTLVVAVSAAQDASTQQLASLAG